MAKVKLSPVMGGVSGRLGNIVLVEQPRYGVVMRQRVRPANPKSPAQQVWRNAMKRAGAAFRMLDSAQYQAWQNWIAGQTAPGEKPIPVVQEFMKLASKFAMANPGMPITLTPPSAPFGGDSVVVVLQTTGNGIAFEPSQPNGAGVVTEILIQPVRAVFSPTYLEKYRSQGFTDFTHSGFGVKPGSGVYACAIRFVHAGTGQAGPILELGAVVVG